MTRKIFESQMDLGQAAIESIKITSKSRDDIPKILRGLQYIYINKALREDVFNLLESEISPTTSKQNGRPGMDLWKILIMGVLRLDLNCDYDRLHELVNQHKTIRQMLGHSTMMDDYEYNLQTIKDNIFLLTEDFLEKLNKLIVDEGHALVKKKENSPLHGRCDSFVVETNVKYPTDIGLLFDATKKVIQITCKLSYLNNLSGWRQNTHNIKQIKRKMRKAQKLKRVSARSDDQKIKVQDKVIAAHVDLINECNNFLDKSFNSIAEIEKLESLKAESLPLLKELDEFTVHAKRQIDQVKRRVVDGKSIPHSEKVFSLYQPHTEWISKGKAGVPVEFGLRVCILEDRNQFILNHRVMEKETDDKIAVEFIKKTKALFPSLESCSFDKGFHSKENQNELKKELSVVALKQKGRLSKVIKERESSDEFKAASYKHSAVESAINALEKHGLDKCNDRGLDGFKRYVALSVVTRNIHRIGDILHEKVLKQEARRRNKKASNNDLLISA